MSKDLKLQDGTSASAVRISGREMPIMALAVTLLQMEEAGLITRGLGEKIIDDTAANLNRLIKGEDIPGLLEHRTKEEFEAATEAKEPATNEVVLI